MRTTLDIDDRVLAAARSQVLNGTSSSIGEAVSRLALRGLAADTPDEPELDGLLLLPKTPGRVITNELVADALLDD